MSKNRCNNPECTRFVPANETVYFCNQCKQFFCGECQDAYSGLCNKCMEDAKDKK